MCSRDQLAEHADALATIESLLAAETHASDPVLWAAHESILCARTLLLARLERPLGTAHP